MRKIPWTSVLLTVVLLALPAVISSYGVRLASEVFIMGIFVMSLGLIAGYAGLVSLGHAAFFGVGAYTVALLGQYVSSSYVLIAAAAVLAGVAAWVSGYLFIRTSGAYFLMITLAFGQMLYAIVYKLKSVTGGADGMKVSASLDFGFGTITSTMQFYYVMAVLFLACYFLLRLFIASPFGKGVKGVMENPLRMKTLGYNIREYQIIAYTLSGMMAGFAGAMYAYFNFFVSPDMVSWMFSGQALIMVIVGGVGTLLGPAVGAAFFVVLQNYVSSFTDRWPLIMGLIFVAFVLYGRGGIVHIFELIWNKIVPQRSRTVSEEKEGETR